MKFLFFPLLLTGLLRLKPVSKRGKKLKVHLLSCIFCQMNDKHIKSASIVAHCGLAVTEVTDTHVC